MFGILITLNLIFQAFVSSFDIRQAFLQADRIEDKFYLKLPKDKKFLEQLPPGFVNPDMRLRIVRPLYGMKDSGNRWIKRMFRCLKEKGFAQCPSEPTLWLKPGKGYLIVYVDDVLWVSCGEGIQSEIDAIFAELKVGKTQILDIDARNNDKQDSFRFLGTSLFRTSDGHIEIDMNDAAQKISPIEIDKELKKQKDLKVPEKLVTQYRGLIGKISWLAMSVKPGLTTVSSMYAGRVPGVTVRDILELNAIVEKIDKSNNRLRFVNLHLDSAARCFYMYIAMPP